MSHTEIDAPVDRRSPTVMPDDRFVRLKVVLSICGKSRSSMYEAIKKGEFPAPVKLNGRSSAWVMSEIQQWLRTCVETSRARQNSGVMNAGDREK